MDFIHPSRIGFVYHLECVAPDGKVLWTDKWENIIPDQGRDYILGAALNAVSQFSNWYIGLYEGNYSPVPADIMATFPAAATEITSAYSETTRVLLVDEPLAAGVYANSVTKAEFTFTTAKTVRGGFISSGATKGGTTGILLSAVLAASPQAIGIGSILRVVAGLSLVTA